MPPVFLPEIEQYAEKDPVLYEILQRLASNVAQSPVLSGNGDPNAGNVPATANSLYIQTGSDGTATGIFVNGTGSPSGWQSLSTIVNPSTAANTAASPMSPTAQKFLKPGTIILGANSSQFDNQGRPQSSFFSNPVDSTGIILIQPLTQSGTSTVILVASHTWQFGEFTMISNSGSVDPGSFGTFNVFFDDIQYRGGAEIYQAAVNGNGDTVKKRGRFFLGQITTSGGGGGTGGGGGNGFCFSGNTKIITREGIKTISCIVVGDQVLSRNGWVRVEKVFERDYSGIVYYLGNGEYVTPRHRFYKDGLWLPAEDIFDHFSKDYFADKVYNLEVDTSLVGDDFHCYMLQNGLFAHNVLKD